MTFWSVKSSLRTFHISWLYGAVGSNSLVQEKNEEYSKYISSSECTLWFLQSYPFSWYFSKPSEDIFLETAFIPYSLLRISPTWISIKNLFLHKKWQAYCCCICWLFPLPLSSTCFSSLEYWMGKYFWGSMLKFKLFTFNTFDKWQLADIYEEQTKFLRYLWYFSYINWVYIHLRSLLRFLMWKVLSLEHLFVFFKWRF